MCRAGIEILLRDLVDKAKENQRIHDAGRRHTPKIEADRELEEMIQKTAKEIHEDGQEDREIWSMTR
jgi:histidine ammonia-lyase